MQFYVKFFVLTFFCCQQILLLSLALLLSKIAQHEPLLLAHIFVQLLPDLIGMLQKKGVYCCFKQY